MTAQAPFSTATDAMNEPDNEGRCVETVLIEDFPEVCDNDRPCPAHDAGNAQPTTTKAG